MREKKEREREKKNIIGLGRSLNDHKISVMLLIDTFPQCSDLKLVFFFLQFPFRFSQVSVFLGFSSW